MVWNLKRSLFGLAAATLRFHEFCALSWWNLVFEVWNAEPTIFFHRLKKTSELWVRTDDPLAPGSSEEALTEFFDGVAKRLAIKTLCLVPCCSDLDEIVERSKLVHMHSFRDAAGMAQCKPVGTLGPHLPEERPSANEHSLYRRVWCKTQSHADQPGCTH